MIARELVALPAIAAEVAEGLFRRPKSLPPKLFYDEAGSALFERITELPEYYLTRTEAAILEAAADEIAAAASPVRSLVELGAGSSRKTTILISAQLRRADLSFFPVDISVEALRAGQRAMRQRFPQLAHAPVIADYTRDLSFLRRIPSPRLVLYLGSSIGNFDPADAVAFLARLRQALGPSDRLLLGADLRKSAKILLPAYDDRRGVTAAFNKNMLARINRELGGHFDLERFRHRAEWNRRESRMEIYLESDSRQSVRIDWLDSIVEFERGELLHTENSYKYDGPMLDSLLGSSGWARQTTWMDKKRWFAEVLARFA